MILKFKRWKVHMYIKSKLKSVFSSVTYAGGLVQFAVVFVLNLTVTLDRTKIGGDV